MTIFFLLSISTTTAANLTVGTTGECSDIETSITQLSTISDENNTIFLEEGTYTGIMNTYITINNSFDNRNLKFIGKGNKNNVIIDGENTAWLFYVTGNVNLSFENITFKNANNPVAGGVITATNGESLTVINCNFSNNNGKWGGAIYSAIGKITIDNTIFENNHGSSEALNGTGGAIYLINMITTLINNSIFTNNQAQTQGGAIFITGQDLTLENITFNNNNNAGEGGAICTNVGRIYIKKKKCF
ncbi:MAG: hypothetical protein LBR24_01860 [Methanobrevibacter sp.]|nr:hypothetical protein [Methanobrevibacter sp.]